MATITYDRLWGEAMGELAEALAVEDPTAHTRTPDGKPLPTVAIAPNEAFEHFRSMYVRYIQIYRKLEQCYEGMIHPQKRVDCRSVIDSVLTRLVQLRHTLVKWAPLNVGVRMATPGKPFPWEYLDFDDKVLELKVQPEALEIPVPRCFVDARYRELKDRDTLVHGYMAKILGVDRVLVELEDVGMLDVPGISFSVAEAVAVIQRNERGRQGKQRAAVWKERRAEDAKASAAASGAASAAGGAARRRGFVASSDDEDSDDDDEMTPEEAAIEIQRIARGFLARRRVAFARDAELVFIGMKDAPRPRLAALEAAMADTVARRRLDQIAHRETYEKALKEMEALVLDEEGADMRDKMRADRTAWWVSKLSEGTIPEDLSGYYAMLQAATRGEGAAAAEEEAEAAKGKGKDAKGKGGKDAKAGAKGKDAGKAAAGKGKGKGKGDDEEEPEKPPPVTGTTIWTKSTETLLRAYEATWVGRDEKDNVAQRHDPGLAREIVRPKVAASVETGVDEAMTAMLANYRAQKLGGDKKDKKDKKKAKKKGDKKKKGKKEKALPGAKACAGMDWDKMLTVLIENRIVNNPRAAATFASFQGGMNLLGSRYSSTDTPAQRHPVFGFWVPQDPSMAQVREALMTYAVAPLGSLELRRGVDEFCKAHNLCGGGLPKTLLLYGPNGTGKTHLAQAVANASGALFFNLSAGNVDGKMAQKDGHKMLLHMVFEVAKDPSLAPCVIYIDEIEKLLPAGTGKKKGASGDAGPARFKKELVPYIKSLTADHAVVVIASSSEPWEADQKVLLDCFSKHVYVPCPDYSTRLQVWRSAVASAIGNLPVTLDGTAAITASALTTTPFDRPVSDMSPWTGGSTGGAAAAGFGSRAAGATDPALEALMSAIPMSAASSSVGASSATTILDRLNFSVLSQVSNGYAVGSIRRAVRATLTPRRLERLGQRPLAESEFLTSLARCPRVYMEDHEKFRAFTDKVTGYDVRREPPKDDDPKAKDKGKAKKK